METPPPSAPTPGASARKLDPDDIPFCPPLDPVQGWGGAEVVNWAADHLDKDEFRATYEHRADHLIRLHGEALTEEAREALAAL